MLYTFQFPLHRDPRCNREIVLVPVEYGCFSSLYIGILAATNINPQSKVKESKVSFSSLYIGILAATRKIVAGARGLCSFSSLYIGILAATLLILI